MMLTNGTTVAVQCDHEDRIFFGLLRRPCGAASSMYAITLEQSEAWLRNLGWMFPLTRDLCPDHARAYLAESVEQ